VSTGLRGDYEQVGEGGTWLAATRRLSHAHCTTRLPARRARRRPRQLERRYLVREHGTVADIVPGSLLEAAYGGSGNLSAVVTCVSPEAAPTFSRAALSN